MTHPRRGFSLVELLVVIAVIAILVGILIPVVASVRKAGWEADVRQQLASIAAGIEAYRLNYGAYPGPFSNTQIGPSATTPGSLPVVATSGFDTSGGPIAWTDITMSENLTLSVLGGLTLAGYNPSLVGQGPQSLLATNPKKYPASLGEQNLSWHDAGSGKTGHFVDAANPAGANDTIIPEFVDRFTNPMPILYMRSRVAVPIVSTGATAANNSVVTNGTHAGPYDIDQIAGYTTPNGGQSIGVGKKFPAHGLQNVTIAAPFDTAIAMDAYPYFLHPTLANTARQKDSFILISAGSDRTYGTADDICNFGAVAR